jgi:DNA adenine methylase
MNENIKGLNIYKISEEKRQVLGCVLIPEVPDAQNDIISEEEIANAAHDFMIDYRKQQSEMGLMHKNTTSKIVILESFIAPVEMMINGNRITKGSWLLKVKINDDQIWKDVKDGKLLGFSIGGNGKRIAEEI